MEGIGTHAKEVANRFIGITTKELRALERLKHGFPRSGEYALIWRNSRTQEKAAAMHCQFTPEAVVLSYSLRRGEENTPVSLSVPLTWTFPNYGGRRAWFLCRCGRRADKLFFRGEQYGCRQCLNLTYQSRLDCRIGRAWGRIYSIGRQLKIHGTMTDYLLHQPPKRPKWMHHRRYYRLLRELEFWFLKKDEAIKARFGNLFPGELAESSQVNKDR